MFMRTRYFKPCPLLPIASQKTTCKLWEVISYSHKVNKAQRIEKSRLITLPAATSLAGKANL